MFITILADASHCPETNAAGYGYWIASNRGKKGGSGAFKTTIVTSTLAEMLAIANSLYIGYRDGLVQKGDEILVQTDCEAAIMAFENKRKPRQEELHAVHYVEEFKKMFNAKICFKHVKGHSSSKDARFAANNHCDKNAREAMRKARAILRQTVKEKK